MLEIVKVVDNKPTPAPGQIWMRDGASYLIDLVNDVVLWTFKLSSGEVTEFVIELKDSWKFKVFPENERDNILDQMADILCEQGELEASARIYELAKCKN